MTPLVYKTITDVPGFFTSGISAGIKKSGKKDLCVIYSEHKAVAAAVFTTNQTKAAPLLINMDHIKNVNTQALVINSGCANAYTGPEGLKNAAAMAQTTAKCLQLSPKEVLVASTGALGTPLPMDSILPGIEKACLALSKKAGKDAAEAILTTDTCTKTIANEFTLSGKKVTMAGMAKGSTMIHPNMGTLLAFIVTDANITKELLQKALKECVNASFNMISIDGDTSTNDMAVILANGASNNTLIDTEDENYASFLESLLFVTTELTRMLALDGEGSTKLIEATVMNAQTLTDARAGAKAIVSSNLVKCAIFGGIANWGDIACALSNSGISLHPDNFDIFIGNTFMELQIAKDALAIGYDNNVLQNIFSGNQINIRVDIKNGESSATAWGCDLTYDYIKGNAYLNN